MTKSLVHQIDTRYGTYNSHAFSNGNTLPLTGVPFGMNYFAPQTTDQNGNWWFNPYEPIYQGIRLTHQPSPWLGDFSQLLLTPVSGTIARSSLFHRQSSYNLKEAVFRPDFLQIHSNRYNITTKLSPTLYGANLVCTSHKAPLGLVLFAPANSQYHLINDHELTIRLDNATETLSDSFCQFVYLTFSQPITRMSRLVDDQELPVKETISGQDLHIRLDVAATDLECRLATSFISAEQAKRNGAAIPSFDQTASQAQTSWDDLLSRVEIEDLHHTKERELFYHCLYRCLLFPQTFFERDEYGQPIHLDTVSQSIKAGKFFTNNGYWDTFRSSYPLLSILYPDYLCQFLEGILHHAKHTGFLPKWLSPDERGIMPGTLVDGVIADAAVKGLVPALLPDLLQAMVQTSQTEDPSGRFGRHGAQDYDRYGYLPLEYRESVSHSLDYAYSDWAIAQVANALGNTDIAQQYTQKSLTYRQLFDPETGFIRAKQKDGQFRPSFSPVSWGQDYAECSALQATLAPLHDIEGLITLMGGKEAFTTYLLNLCIQTPQFETDQYGYEIHEMSEMAQTTFGQLAISNQPSFHIPYLFHWSSHPEYTSLLVKHLRTHCFQPGFAAYPGDEDNGSLSAWYIFSCLGFYPVCPGTTRYQIGIPQFDHVRLHLPREKELRITTNSNQDHFLFVQQVRLNGTPQAELDHFEILQGGELNFTLSILPQTKKEA